MTEFESKFESKFVEMRPRKAKFGFQIKHVNWTDMPVAGIVIQNLSANFRDEDYKIEFNCNYSTRQLVIYTDVDVIADAIRNWCKVYTNI